MKPQTNAGEAGPDFKWSGGFGLGWQDPRAMSSGIRANAIRQNLLLECLRPECSH